MEKLLCALGGIGQNPLLSGLAGALIATLLAIIYQSVNYRAKHRLEITLKVVEHLDSLCYFLLNLREHSDHAAGQERAGNETKTREYQILKNKINRLLEDSIASIYIKSSYGNDSGELEMFIELHNEVRQAEEDLITGIYTNDLDDFDQKFEKEIEPLRKKLMERLLKKTNGWVIFFDGIFYFPRKIKRAFLCLINKL